MVLTPKLIRETLREKMIDPELGMNVVDLGLIYDIKVTGYRLQVTGKSEKATRQQPRAASGSKVHILMTLTTPGCPLAAIFMPMIRQALSDIPGFDPYNDLQVDITFDPPWHPGLMSQRAKAEMGL